MKNLTILLGLCLALSGCDLLGGEGGSDFDGGFGGQGGQGGEGGFAGAGGVGGFGGGIDDICLAGCVALDECELCADDGADGCLTVEDCADECRNTGDEAKHQCLADAQSCDEATLDACFAGGEGDACDQACQFLDDCEVCLPDETPDGCLTLAQCAESCRAGEADATCINQLQSCDEAPINACLEGEEVDVCTQSCLELEQCEVCAVDENGDCVATEVCAEECRQTEGGEEQARCVTKLPTCDEDEINACYGVK